MKNESFSSTARIDIADFTAEYTTIKEMMPVIDRNKMK